MMHENELLRTIGKRISEEREQRNLSVQQLSEMTGMTRQYVHQIQNGQAVNVSVVKLLELCEALQIHINQIFPLPNASNAEMDMILSKLDSLPTSDKESIFEAIQLLCEMDTRNQKLALGLLKVVHQGKF